MVVPPSVRPARRGQLLLIGSLTIAFMILGLVAVTNGLLFTQTTSQTGALDDIQDAQTISKSSRRHARDTILRVNHRKRNFTADTLAGNVRGNVTNFSQTLQELYVDRTPVYVNLTYHNDTSRLGTRIVQAADSEYTTPANDTHWYPVPENERRDIGRFVLNLNLSRTTTNEMYVNVSNDTSEYVNISLNRSGNSVNVETDHSVSGSQDVTCPGSNSRFLFDLRTGRSFASDCAIATLQTIEPPYAVEITRGANAEGRFALVTTDRLFEFSESGSLQSYDHCNAGAALLESCRVPVISTANVTVHYQSESVQFARHHNLSVYP
jgi:hypothetical protein